MTALPMAPANPMPKFFRHPLRVTYGKIQMAGSSVVFGHLGIFAIVALYYLLFEVWHPATVAWHHLVGSSYWRHLIRNVGEYFLGTLLVLQITVNPFKKKFIELKKTNLLDRLELKLHVPNLHQKHHVSGLQLVASPVIALIYAIPGFLLGAGAVYLLHHWLKTGVLAPTLSAHPSFAAKLYADSLDQHVVGIIAGFIMGRRPMQRVFLDIQHFFAERRVARGKHERVWHTLPFRMLVQRIIATEGQAGAAKNQSNRGTWVPVLMIGGLVVLLALAGFGYHVLHDIA